MACFLLKLQALFVREINGPFYPRVTLNETERRTALNAVDAANREIRRRGT